ncbi:MAG TPA: protein translocase subunit SecD [Patescibacteria group bacterium]|jgi:preprotein translocase subunit SecD|nr:protein translocase subunit SecD [Patescibacteria group bacterium]
MRKNPRYLLWLIIGLTIAAVFINLPKFSNVHLAGKTFNFDPNSIFAALKINQTLNFREGLDLKGGTSLVLRANMKNIASDQKSSALNSAKTVIENRVNLFGVSEPLVQTAVTNNNDYRINVEIPGVTDVNQVRNLIGTTAQLNFWEEIASSAAKLNSVDVINAGGTYFKKTDLTGSDLKQTSVGFDQNTGKPEVQLVFNSTGAKKFADITQRTVGKRLAIMLDNQIIEAPTVNQAIEGGNAVITGGFTTDTATQLSTELNAGALPVPLSILSSSIIEPTLGSASLAKSLFAGALGFIIIVVFMTTLYKKLGAIASVALTLYTLFVLAIFKLSSITPYGITLTLSGIAGFILSIGMAVDANILIFERMKEELRQGKSHETAIELGFSRAWTSIRDSNISTLITSFVLYEFGTGMVKGFALVLAIGVLVSMFSAIVVTRTFLRLIYK